MKIIYFDEIDSTQIRLIEDLKKKAITPPVCYWSEYQTNGIGSRGNRWLGERGNLFFSFALKKDLFDVPLQSFSIYFGYILKEVLREFGSNVKMKWPNDLYLNKKIGGVITNIVGDYIVCGIGLNTKKSIESFESLDIEIKNDKILKRFFEEIEKRPKFDEIIKKYKIEFEKTKSLFSINGTLANDGSLIQNNKKVYSRR